jgi:hypothetical protein
MIGYLEDVSGNYLRVIWRTRLISIHLIVPSCFLALESSPWLDLAQLWSLFGGVPTYHTPFPPLHLFKLSKKRQLMHARSLADLLNHHETS